MSDSTGGGSVGGGGASLAGIGSLLSTLFGSTTTTNQNQTTNADTSSTTNLSSFLNSLVSNSASPAVLASLTSAAKIAGTNASNPTATDALVQNIMRQSAIAFAPTVSKANGAGLYNSTSLGELAGENEAEATGEAATAVTNYQTQQAALQASILSTLAGATKTTGTGQTQGSTQGSNTKTNSNTISSGSSNNSGVVGQLSQVCTYMAKVEGSLPRLWWKVSSNVFFNYPNWVRNAYYIWSTPLLQHLKTKPKSFRSELIRFMFYNRSKYIAWRQHVSNVNFTFTGLCCNVIMAMLCISVALFLCLYKKNKVEFEI